jgi:hypothetical protein
VIVAGSGANWPEWWQWELDCSNPHLAKRMLDRSFTEVDLREMLENAGGFRPDASAGRWIIETKHASKAWEIIVEPDKSEKLLVIVTAYRVK